MKRIPRGFICLVLKDGPAQQLPYRVNKRQDGTLPKIRGDREVTY